MNTNIKFNDKQNAESVELFDVTISKIPKRGTQTGIANIYTGFYNLFENGNNGFKRWIKYGLGKEPVLFTSDMIKNTEARLQYYIIGKGFFGNEISCDTASAERKVNINCEVTLGERYKVDSIVFPVDSTYAALKLNEELKRVIIKEGIYYDRDRLDFERMRLAKLAGSIGFANFGSENIYYYVDTLAGNHKVDIYAKVITPTDSTFHTRYTMDSIRIFPNYAINVDNKRELKIVPIKDKMEVHETDHYLEHSLLKRLILEDVDTFYNRVAEQSSINRLLDLGLFKFININNYPSGSGKNGKIVQEILLTPEKIQNISGEVELNNRSGNFLGIGASAKYQHKNLFRHAERLNISLGGQVETQFGSDLSLINSSDLTGSIEIEFPRFIVPFFNITESRNFIPRTIINTSATRQRRTNFYTLQSFAAKYGYKWRRNKKVLHEFYPLVINQVSVSGISDEFQQLLDEDARLKNSFEDIFIGGLQYYFSYSDQLDNKDNRYSYFRGEIETSGTVLGLLFKKNGSEPAKVAGEKFAQYLKLTLDYRKYFPFASGNFATRVIVGGGLAYGNSKELPYIKQYVIGGANSVRAFRLRGLGPGTTPPDESPDPFAAQFVDQTGDIKLEMNIEYRFPIFNYLKGAVFVDAGNVWLVGDDQNQTGAFNFNSFYKEIGIGTGLGFRLDFDFFLIRMDIAFPLRAPTQNSDFAWQFSEINPLDKNWRVDNLRYNLGIGYPF
jgi:outer membrane protein assembly factor BamA